MLEVSDLKKHFPVRKGLLRRTVGHVYAVDGVSFTIGAARRWGWSAKRLRQVHGRPHRAAADRADRRQHQVDGTDITRLGKAETAALPARRCRSSSRTRSPRSIRA